MNKILWEYMGFDVHVGITPLNDCFRGLLRFRVDGRGEVRVDKRTLGPWESIDGGAPFPSVDQGKAFAEVYYQAACEQRTVSPKGVSRE